MSKKIRIALEESEAQKLEKIIRKGKNSARTITRARVLLMANENGESKSNKEIIEINSISTQLLGKEISRFHDMQKHVFAWVNNRNKKQIGIKWQFTREKAIDKFKS